MTCECAGMPVCWPGSRVQTRSWTACLPIAWDPAHRPCRAARCLFMFAGISKHSGQELHRQTAVSQLQVVLLLSRDVPKLPECATWTLQCKAGPAGLACSQGSGKGQGSNGPGPKRRGVRRLQLTRRRAGMDGTMLVRDGWLCGCIGSSSRGNICCSSCGTSRSGLGAAHPRERGECWTWGEGGVLVTASTSKPDALTPAA
jgi:hypothetical protein